MKSVVAGIVSVLFVWASVAGGQDIIANSVTDFSGTQGENGWYYGYYSGSLTPDTFRQFPNYSPTAILSHGNGPQTGDAAWYLQLGVGGYWTQLWSNGGHPNGTDGNWGAAKIEQWAVRRWQSETAGSITISGSIGSGNGGNMNVLILDNGSQILAEQVPSLQTTYSLSTNVSVGSDIDFVIAPSNGSEVNGATVFTGEITATPTPEPSTFVFLSVGTVTLLGYRWRRRLAKRSVRHFGGTMPVMWHKP
jgi:hypothetical protein